MADGDKIDWEAKLAGTAGPQNNFTDGDGKVDWEAHLAANPSPIAPTESEPESGLGEQVVRKAKVAGNAVVGAVQNLAGLPGTLQAATNETRARIKPKNALESTLMAIQSATSPPKALMPSSNQISQVTGLGETNKDLQPKTTGERYLAAGAAALPDAAMLALTGGGALPALATTEGGAMAAQAAKEAMPGSTWAPIVAGIVGSLGVQGVVGWLQASSKAKAAVELLNNKESALDEAKSAFSNVVNDASEARDVATAKLAQLKSASSGRVDSIKNFVTNMTDHIEATAKGTTDWVAEKLGSSTTPEQVGKIAQTEMRDWVAKSLPAQEKALIAPVNAVMETESLAPSGLKAMAESLPKAKLSALKNNLPPDLLDSFESAVDLGTEIPWNDMRRIRTEIGTMLKSNKIANDIGESRLEALYSAGTADLTRAAKASGVGDQFAHYNNEMTKLYNFRDNIANKFITTGNANAESQLPGAAAKGFLTRAGTEGTEIAALRQQTSKVADELGSFAIRNGHWESLSPEAKLALVAHPDQAQALDSATAAVAQAKGNGAGIVSQAESEHKALLEAAQSDKLKEMLASRATSRQAKATVTAAKAAVEAATAAVPTKANPITNLVHQVRGATAGVIGNELMGALTPGLPPGVRTGLLAAGYALPAMYRGAKHLLSNPGNLLTAGTGAAQGAQVNQMNKSLAGR